MTDIPILEIKKSKEKALRKRHPWVFSGAVQKKPQAHAGEVVKIVNSEQQILGHGFYFPGKTICCQVFDFENTTFEETDEYWDQKLTRAYEMRKCIPAFESLTGFRLINSEGDFIPGLIVDIYGNTASIQFRNSGVSRIKEILISFLKKTFQIQNIWVSSKTKDTQTKGWEINEAPIEPFEEWGIKYKPDPESGQKTGFFLDQRDSRFLVRKYAKGKTALDLFCYSGGFSMNALKGGAELVTSVDISQGALDLVESNRQLNEFDNSNHNLLKADCFKYLKEMPEKHFDLIVLDPPAFTKHISTVQQASRGYKEINLKAITKIKTGGILFTFSCSQHLKPSLFRKIIFAAAEDSGRKVRILHILGHGPDHPIDICHPEGEYLKGLALYVE